MSEAATVSKVDEKKDDKPSVDNATLAFMLRESADIVEKGEFDVILYHALQDFRTYYKLHLPKRKEKAKKKPAAAATAPADSGENSSDAAATSSSDAQKEANTKPAETTGEATPPTVSADPSTQELPAEQSKSDNSARETSAGATVISEEGTESRTTPSTSDPPASSSKLQVDGPESAAVEPGAPENPINTESGRMGSMDSVLDSGRSAEDFDNEASLRDAQAKQNHFAPFGKKAKNTGSKISAGMFASKTKMKLPKKLPKIHVNLPSSGKKKREAELADLTGGEVAQYAESSRRRAAVGGEDGNDAVMQSPQRSSKLAPAVTGLDDKEIRSTSATNPVDRVREDEPADAENEKPSSLRNNETHNATNNSASVHPTTATASAPSTASSSEVFVADPRSESFEYEMPDHGHGKPAFQRPKNKNSAVVANGWIEQQRRSKMRTVWKEVLASLVQGRRPGEETTLWIQREAVDPTTGKKELEALHQVPVKLLESVVYSEYTTDDRFSLKLYNSHEEFVFRCNNDPSAAMNWVTILQQFEMETKQNGAMPPPTAPTESVFPDFPEEKKGPDVSERSSSPTPNRLAIRDLRAICHGAGINTVGMERANLERAAAEVQKRGTYFAPPSAGHAAVPPIPPAAAAAPVGASTGSASTARSASPLPPKSSEPSAPVSNGATGHKMSIKDLRAICHGAGISTVGMERGELERAAAEVQKRGTYFAPPPGAVPPVAPRPGADAQPEDEAGKKEEIRQKQAAEDEARRRAAEEEHWRRHEEESRRRAAEDEHRRRAEEEHRRRAAEEERRRRMAEQQARQAEDQRRRYMEQQAAWQHQQQQEEQRRRLAEQQAAEHRRIHEENMRKQQQWGGQQPQHHPQGWSQHHHPHQHYQQHPQQQHWTPQQQQQWHQQQQRHQQYPQQHAPPRGPSPQQHPPQESKYAKMANQTDDDGQAAITKLKHDILIQWALQPPQLQMLRSVDVLLSTIQTVFPPALGVPAHDYFRKWKVVTRESVLSDVGIIDEEKVKKAVRKLRFFLHPDKLPKDLNKEQEFMVKMLWDITNDAWEEYEKSKADLDWVK
ncbi:unnamed protein product [Cylindrotheca closterium]|uniref:PH domain-containing protein n=1 Tax=Cylindrotheca closterium TaxID=2856 RepID=A0AAD2FJK1_9STRA|nr:unnamed protein product [Cylindrotheca closterium]